MGSLDPRLTDFDWDARTAAPVERLIDPHTHYNGNPDDLDILCAQMEAYNTETIFVNSIHHAGTEWLADLEARGKIGERFIPYFRVELDQNNPDTIQEAYDLGFWGIKWISPARSYDDRFYDPLLERMQQLGMPALFHTGLLAKGEYGQKVGTGMSLMRPDCLDTISSRFPELLIQGAHLGNPHIADAVLSCVYSPNLIWDASGGCRHLLKVDPQILEAPMYGRSTAWERIMWSTDTATGVFRPEYSDGWPSQFEYQLAFWQDIFSRFQVPPTTEQLDMFFYGNAHTWLDRIIANRQG